MAKLVTLNIRRENMTRSVEVGETEAWSNSNSAKVAPRCDFHSASLLKRVDAMTRKQIVNNVVSWALAWMSWRLMKLASSSLAPTWPCSVSWYAAKTHRPAFAISVTGIMHRMLSKTSMANSYSHE